MPSARVVVLVYLAAALRFLDDEHARLWPAAAALATGALFHLEPLVLGPSLLVDRGFRGVDHRFAPLRRWSTGHAVASPP